MGEATKIQWTDHTFNAWWGCTKVSPGCAHCYAETFDKRIGGGHWGSGAERRVFGTKHWAEPRKWNYAAIADGRRRRVFCSSMADVFDAEAPVGELDRLWSLIRETPMLDWQLLTKRADRIASSLPPDWGDRGYPNVWLGVTVEDRRRLRERMQAFAEVPAAVRFLSCEPLLEDIAGELSHGFVRDPNPVVQPIEMVPPLALVDWIIVGGESGGGARPCAIEWIESVVYRCVEAGVACFVKQLGAKPVSVHRVNEDGSWAWVAGLADRKGGDPSEWPEQVRVRRVPGFKHRNTWQPGQD